MKKICAILLSLLTGVILLADNLLKNPEFSGTLDRNSKITGWLARKTYCRTKDKTLQINIPAGGKLQILSEKVVLDQKERCEIEFGLDYQGVCATKSWEQCLVLANLTYQDGTKEKWPKVMIMLPLKAEKWQSLKKRVLLPKPVKSFNFMIALKDETKAAVRNPYVREVKKSNNQKVTLVLPASPNETEKFAAKELADHIAQMTGKRPAVINENSPAVKGTAAIYIGRTAKAKANGFDFARFADEQWQISSVDDGVVIGGGKSRGTLYGAYHYLEKVCGVRWFNPFETFVPKRQNIPFRDLYLSGKPAFLYRAIFTQGHDFDTQFLSRNRQNANYSGYKISGFDGIAYIGPSVHTHCLWINPKKYLKSNPEFYALWKGGKRTTNALCLMNKECRKVMIDEVRSALRKRYAEAKKNPLSSIQIVNISHMDEREYCLCKDCKAFAEKHQALSACDIDFINEVAGALKKEFPAVIFMTLAYTYTEKPPVEITVADNVCVQMCDTTSNVTVPVTHPDNQFFSDCLTKWTRICKNVLVWDYWITYNFNNGALGRDLPCATVENIAADLRFFRELGVPYFLSEQEYLRGSSDVYDFKQYVALKLLENPQLDPDRLTKQFAEEYYGPAGKLFLEYRSKLKAVQKKWHPNIQWDPHVGRYTYLTLDFLKEMQTLFDRGEKLLASDPVRLIRWQRARISLDRAVCLRISYLIEEFLRRGLPVEKFPFDLDLCAKRIQRAILKYGADRYEVRNIRLPQKNSATVARNLKRDIDNFLKKKLPRLTMTRPAIPTNSQLPAELAKVPRKDLHILPFGSAYLHNEFQKAAFKLIPSKDSIFGSAAAITFASNNKARKAMMLQVFTYQTDTKTFHSEIKLPADRLEKAGWQWIKFGKVKVGGNTYLAITGTWGCQLDLSNLAGPERALRELDLWLRVRCQTVAGGNTRVEFDTLILKDTGKK